MFVKHVVILVLQSMTSGAASLRHQLIQAEEVGDWIPSNTHLILNTAQTGSHTDKTEDSIYVSMVFKHGLVFFDLFPVVKVGNVICGRSITSALGVNFAGVEQKDQVLKQSKVFCIFFTI